MTISAPRFQSTFHVYNWPPGSRHKYQAAIRMCHVYPHGGGHTLRIENHNDDMLQGALERSGLREGRDYTISPY